MSNGLPNWSRALPRPLVIPKVMTLKTLADVRELIGHLPADRRALDTWRHVSKQLTQAAMTERRFPPPLIRQAHLQPKASAHRAVPKRWENAVRKIAEDRARHYQRLAEQLK